jgi:hypothetical protein
MKWTKEEIEDFSSLTRQASSIYRFERINAQENLPDLIKELGKKKCDAMLKHLEAGGKESDFDDGE